MSLRPGYTPDPVHLNVISGRGGLGDGIARLPTFKYVHDTFEHVSMTIYAQDGWYDVLAYLLPPTPRLEYKRLSEAPWELKRPILEFDPDRLTSLHMHLTDHAYAMFDMQPPSQAERCYPEAREVTNSYMQGRNLNLLNGHEILVFTTDYTAPVRQWPAVHINRLAQMCRKAGFTPVLLGATAPIPTGVPNDDIKPFQADGLKTELFVDLRGKTTLIEALGIMQRSKAVIGLDNGLLHLAHCTNVPVVIGYTSLLPQHRVPGRVSGATEVLEAQVPCNGCQSRGFMISRNKAGQPHDWRKCLFDDYACTLTMSAERFYAALQKLQVVP